MLEKTGDLWSAPAEFKCVTTNGIRRKNGWAVMGAGVALQAAEKFPDLPRELGFQLERFGNIPFIFYDYGIITFPTKHHWKDKSDLELIKHSAKKLVWLVNDYKINSVAVPRPGCSNGKLKWDDVRFVLDSILDNRFTIYEK